MRSIMYWWHTYIVRACMRQKRKFGSCVNYQETFVFGLGTYVHRKYIWRHVNFRYSLCYARPSKTFVHCAIGVRYSASIHFIFLALYRKEIYILTKAAIIHACHLSLYTNLYAVTLFITFTKHCSFTVSSTYSVRQHCHTVAVISCEAWKVLVFMFQLYEDRLISV